MPLLLTSVLPFLAHDHPAAVAFLTCRHHNFHASIIPEFLSNEEQVKSFCGARQQSKLESDQEKEFVKLYNLFVQTPLMQFSSSLIVHRHSCDTRQHNQSAYRSWHNPFVQRRDDFVDSILKPLLQTKYFSRTLQRCSVIDNAVPLVGDTVALTNDLLHALSKVRSLYKLDLGLSGVKSEHLEIIVNCFPSLETLSIQNAGHFQTVGPNGEINVTSPAPPATKTMRSLTMLNVDPLFAIQFIPTFPYLRKLELGGHEISQKLDLLPLSSSLPLLTDLELTKFTPNNTESLKNLVLLSAIRFKWCNLHGVNSLSFLLQENALPNLTTLCTATCKLSTSSSFVPLSHAPYLRVLELSYSDVNNDCLKNLEKMVHLRKLNLNHSSITADSESLENLMQNLFQLEELNLESCENVGNRGLLAEALYSTHSRLRVLDLSFCNLVDDDLNGIGALKNTLEVLDLSYNSDLTNEGLVHCMDLVKLKILKLQCVGIDDLSPLKECSNLEELDVSYCGGLTDESFTIFSEEPNSFPNLRVLSLWWCQKLTEKSFEYLSKNNHLVHRLKELNVGEMPDIFLFSPSTSAVNNICQLKGLQRLYGILPAEYDDYISDPDIESPSDRTLLKGELLCRLNNLEEIY